MKILCKNDFRKNQRHIEIHLDILAKVVGMDTQFWAFAFEAVQKYVNPFDSKIKEAEKKNKLHNADSLAKLGFDTAENNPRHVLLYT